MVEADYTWIDDAFRPGIQIAIDGNGRIAQVGDDSGQPATRLTGQAILPGFINSHSHAFQRNLRGSGERFPAGQGDFWSWRNAMYELVDRVDPDMFYRVCVSAYREMRRRGITTVGEFHYLHHAAAGADYALDEIVLEAARTVGIRLALLQAYYRTGGPGHAASGAQRRFVSPSLESYWIQMEALATQLESQTQSLGVVAHSVRAADLDDITSLHQEARSRDLVFHIHVEEQQREIDECLALYGKRPLRLINELGDLSNVTAVHCTHSQQDALGQFRASGGTVCVCPLTEANLGDGIPNLSVTHGAGHGVALGTDSNARISMIEEMRWLEYGQRLATHSRGVLRDREGRVSVALLHAATENGARSLGIRAGRIAPGYPADFVAIDLDAQCLAGWSPENLLDGLIFGGSDEVVAATCVAGRWLTNDPEPDR